MSSSVVDSLAKRLASHSTGKGLGLSGGLEERYGVKGTEAGTDRPEGGGNPAPEDRAEGLQRRPSGSLALWRAGRHPEVDGRPEDKE
jgi:hypothetical protein